MKFNTPAPLGAESGFPLLEKGGHCIMMGGGYGTQGAGLSYASAGTGFAHRHSFMFFVVINNAIFYREPPTTTKTLGRVVVVVGELVGDIVPV